MEKQSFSYHAKEEILEKINTKAKADVCLMGILVFCNILSDREIVFLTEHSSVADFLRPTAEEYAEMKTPWIFLRSERKTK